MDLMQNFIAKIMDLLKDFKKSKELFSWFLYKEDKALYCGKLWK